MTRAIVFDFDGVLADSEGLHLAAFQEVLAARGWQLDADTYYERYLGFDDTDLVREFAQDRALDVRGLDIAALAAEKGAVYERRLAEGSLLYPGAAAVVGRLRDRFVLGIASGSLTREIDAVLERAGLRESFAVIVGADSVARGKPAPDPYLRAVRCLGVAPARAVAVEDSQWGLVSARAAGLRAIGITTSYPAAALGGADAVVGSLDDITVALVERLLS